MTRHAAHLEIPPLPIYLNPARAFILGCAAEVTLKEEKMQAMERAAGAALSLVLLKNQRGKGDEPIRIEVRNGSGKFSVEILNRGIPIFPSDCTPLYEASKRLDDLSIENQGRNGQSITLEVQQEEETLTGIADPPGVPVGGEAEDLAIKRLLPGEETLLSKLFYHVYGYKYVDESVYYPEKLRTRMEQGTLISIAAQTRAGRLAGHVGLVRRGESPPVYEAALGLVDPRFKSRGLFTRIMEKAMEAAREIPMQYLFLDFVTNHDYSQRLLARYHPVDLALFVGCQTRTTQASLREMGMGEDPQGMDRYTLLFSVLPMVEHPFGQEIQLPESIGGPLGFLLEPLGLSWTPVPRFSQLQPGGEYKTRYQPAQGAAIFDLRDPGRNAVDRILEEWNELQKNGYQYAAIEIPLDAPGTGVLHDILRRERFLPAGFIPYHLSSKLGFRFQSLGPTHVAFDQIKVHSETAGRLLGVIRDDYERSRL